MRTRLTRRSANAWGRAGAVVALAATLWLGGCASPPAEPPTSRTVGQVQTYAEGRLSLQTPPPAGDGVCRWQLNGSITAGALQAFHALWAQAQKAGCARSRIALDTDGGTVADAVTLGSMLKNRGFDTELPPGAGCLTACALVFAAGRERVLSDGAEPARIGLQRLPPDLDFDRGRCDTEASRGQQLILARYLRAMLPEPAAGRLYQRIMAADCQAVTDLPAAEAVAMGLATALR